MKKVSFFDSLETRLEKYIEGIFKEKQCGNIQPVDIAKKLLREMKNGKRVSVDSVFVPNNYIIFLNKTDLNALTPYINILTNEMQEYLIKKVRERKYTLVGKPVITFQSEEGVDVGDIKVEGSYIQAGKMSLSISEGLEQAKLEKTQRYSFKKISTAIYKAKQPYLVIEQGADIGKSFNLSGERLFIGRDRSCDIVLADSSISRRHAVLEQRGKLYVIRDLNSTNGTFVNGVRITEKSLKPGDKIKLGITLCSIKVNKL